MLQQFLDCMQPYGAGPAQSLYADFERVDAAGGRGYGWRVFPLIVDAAQHELQCIVYSALCMRRPPATLRTACFQRRSMRLRDDCDEPLLPTQRILLSTEPAGRGSLFLLVK